VLIRYLSAKIPYQHAISWLSLGLHVACCSGQCRAAAGSDAKLKGRPTDRATGEHVEPQFIAKMSARK